MRLPAPITFAFAALLFAAVGGPTHARADDALDPKPTAKNGISLQLPHDWKCQPRDSAHILLAAAAPASDTDTSGDYAPGLTITIAPIPPGSAIDGPAQQDRLSRDIPNYQVTEKPSTLRIHGIDAITFGGTFTAGSLKLRTRQYLLAQNDHIYTLTITALASTWDLHIATTQASVMTFTVEKK